MIYFIIKNSGLLAQIKFYLDHTILVKENENNLSVVFAIKYPPAYRV